MLFERLVIALESIAESLRAGAALPPASQTGMIDTPATQGDKPKRGRPRSTDAAPPDAPSKPAEAKAPDPTPAQAQPPQEPAFDYEVLKRSVIELASFGDDGRAGVLKVFAKYKVPDNKASNAKPEQWEAIYKDIQAELTKLQTGESEEAEDFA